MLSSRSAENGSGRCLTGGVQYTVLCTKIVEDPVNCCCIAQSVRVSQLMTVRHHRRLRHPRSEGGQSATRRVGVGDRVGTLTLTLDYNVIPCAGDYSLKLCLLSLRYPELVKCLLQIVKKGFPFCRGNLQI